jgi:hypothetical protein
MGRQEQTNTDVGMKLKIGDMIEVIWTDTVTRVGWGETAKVEPVSSIGRLKTFPNPKAQVPSWEVVAMSDKTFQNTNQSTAIPASSVVGIYKLQRTRGLVDLV